MTRINPEAVIFSINSFAAATLALYVSFEADLPRPYWAVMTVYIVSQPLAGAVRAKAIYRVLGTLMGAAFSLLVLPIFINTPYLLSLILAAWVALCLTLSLLNRSPSAYGMMLAGYTATLICFPIVQRPDLVFDTAVARVEEIVLGIGCATLTHSLIFPQHAGPRLKARVASWLSEANQWALAVLRREDPYQIFNARHHMAGALTEIHLLSLLLPFDPSVDRGLSQMMRLVHERLLRLAPLLTAINDRLTRLNQADAEDGSDQTAGLLTQISNWLENGADVNLGRALTASIHNEHRNLPGGTSGELMRFSLMVRLGQMVEALTDAYSAMAAPTGHSQRAMAGIQSQGRIILHSDIGLALASGLAAFITIMFVCVIWIETGWADGATAAALAGVFCALFATLDDPAPAITGFGIFSLVALVLAAFYLFAILPGIDGFPLLILFLAPPFLFFGYLMVDRRTMLPGLACAIGLASSLALQETYSADFTSFANANSGLYVGLFAALIITRIMRSLSVEAAIARLIRQQWQHLTELARGHGQRESISDIAELVDRLGLLTPRVALLNDPEPMIKDALNALRLGVALSQINSVAAQLADSTARWMNDLRPAIAKYCDDRAGGRTIPISSSALPIIDNVITALLQGDNDEPARTALAAAIGLRCNLFPEAPAILNTELMP